MLHALLGTEPLLLDGHSLPCALLLRCDPCHHTWQELHDSKVNIAPQPPPRNWRPGQSSGLHTRLLDAMGQKGLQSLAAVERAMVPRGLVCSGKGNQEGWLALWSRAVRHDSTLTPRLRNRLTDARVQLLEGMLSGWLDDGCPGPPEPPPPPPSKSPSEPPSAGSSGDDDDEPQLSSYGIPLVTPTVCTRPGS